MPLYLFMTSYLLHSVHNDRCNAGVVLLVAASLEKYFPSCSLYIIREHACPPLGCSSLTDCCGALFDARGH